MRNTQSLKLLDSQVKFDWRELLQALYCFAMMYSTLGFMSN